MSVPRESLARRLAPFGIFARGKPRHYREILRILLENRGSWRHAWRILKSGVCDGCSLGPRGLRDDVAPGIHLCLTRLKLLRFNTMGALDPRVLEDVSALRRMNGRALQALGRVPFPLLLRPGDRAVHRLSWEEAVDLVAREAAAIPPDRMAFFATSRGLANEAYWAFQKLARAAGSANVDLCARLCHAASVHGLGETLGIGAPTVSLADMIGTDLLLLFGTDIANNQPVTTKYIHHAKRRGTRVIVVNPVLEGGLVRYWVPSIPRSALFGTRIMDDFFQVAVGGDIAFLNGVLRILIEDGAIDRTFIGERTRGFEAMAEALRGQPFEDLERSSGLRRADMKRFADQFAAARTCVAVYSMGLTQHPFGVDNVKALVNLMLSRGMVGAPWKGILPIRGHSGVQGGGEIGVDPGKLPGGVPLTEASAARFSELMGIPVPARPGLRTVAMMEAALEGRIDLLYAIGGNLIETMPDSEAMRRALGRVRLRIHQDIVLNTSSVAEGAGPVLVLPAQTRYEHAGGITSTNTERRVRFSPEIPGPRIPEARAEWEIPALLARALAPAHAAAFAWKGTPEIREEIERVMPLYAGIASLRRAGDSLQWGGRVLFEGGRFDRMPGGRAVFTPVAPPRIDVPEGAFVLTTRRGRQFNSMVLDDRDRLQGGRTREDVFMSAADAESLGLAGGDRVTLRSATGSMNAILRIGPIRAGTLQAYWPEANVLIGRRTDPVSGEPDYHEIVRVERA